MESRIVYFDDRKPENTRIPFQLVKERLTNSAPKSSILCVFGCPEGT